MANYPLPISVVLAVLVCGTWSSPVFFPSEEAAPGGGGVEKALVDETVVEAVNKVGQGASSSESGESVEENSTQPVKKLLIRTFTDLHPKIALELINKTMAIINETDSVNVTSEHISLTTTVIPEEDLPATTTTEPEPEKTTTAAPSTKTTTPPAPPSHTSTSTTEATVEEKELEEIEKEIEADPVILTQGV